MGNIIGFILFMTVVLFAVIDSIYYDTYNKTHNKNEED